MAFSEVIQHRGEQHDAQSPPSSMMEKGMRRQLRASRQDMNCTLVVTNPLGGQLWYSVGAPCTLRLKAFVD